MKTLVATLIDFDTTTFLWVNRASHNRPLMKASRLISHTGDGPFYFTLGVAAWLAGGSTGFHFFTTALLAFLLELPVYVGLKKLFKRDRPCHALLSANAAIVPSDKFSLPSGHTAAAFVMAVLISHFYPDFSTLAYLWAMCIGTSRVLLGVHYPTDILAGALLGTSVATTVLTAGVMTSL